MVSWTLHEADFGIFILKNSRQFSLVKKFFTVGKKDNIVGFQDLALIW